MTEWLDHSNALQPKLLCPLLLAAVPPAAHPLVCGVQQSRLHPMDLKQHRRFVAGALLSHRLGQPTYLDKPATAQMPQFC